MNNDDIKNLPTGPGVYFFKNSMDRIIYVGKAKSIRNRVRSYFTNDKSSKIYSIRKNTNSIEYIVTDSEVEALILECNMIKRHRPKYNVLLKDDKTYPYIKITNESFPRIIIVRRIKKDGAKYYGPYANAGSVKETIKLIKRLFPIRSCKKDLSETPIKDRECLNYQIKRCMAPCQNRISEGEYNQYINNIEMFLSNRYDKLEKRLEGEMKNASEKMEYEKALELRDQLISLKNITEKQKVVSSLSADQDIIACVKIEGRIGAGVFHVRRGKLVESDIFTLSVSYNDEKIEDILTSFIKQYYNNSVYIPKEIIISNEINDASIIINWLEEKKGEKVKVYQPKRGEKKNLVQMVKNNTILSIKKDNLVDFKNKGQETVLENLAKKLGLSKSPERIEAFDISNIQGRAAVASMIVFENGEPAKNEYRKFRIKTVKGPDDYASMKEVLKRRFERLLLNDSKFSSLPDLVLIDGGKGQLNSALEVITELELNHIQLIGLAKQFEYIFLPENKEPIILPKDSKELYLIQRIRDEAHRFAITYHRKIMKKRNISSALDNVPGVGAKRKRILLETFGSVKEIKKASIDELVKVKGIDQKTAEAIYENL